MFLLAETCLPAGGATWLAKKHETMELGGGFVPILALRGVLVRDSGAVLLAPGPRSTSLGRSVPPQRPPLVAFGCLRHLSGMQKRSLLRQLMSRQETTTVSSRDNLSCGWQELYTYLSILVCRSALIYTPIYIFIHTEFFSLRGTMRTSVALVLCLCVSACV